VVTDARVDEGPQFKRVRPQSRGQAFMVKRRTSHIRVTVQDINEI
jgi:large subunit ribosomal protein L22